MPAVARIGDHATHPGTITSASPNVKANGLAVARNGDTFNCEIDGPQIMTAITTKTKVNGKLVITVGATCPCGAVITTGSPTVNAT